MKYALRKSISTILTLVMAISLLPTISLPSANAADKGRFVIVRTGDEYGSLQEAANAALSGDTIEVAQTSYFNSVIVDGKSITIFIPTMIALTNNYYTSPGYSVGGTAVTVRNGGSLRVTRGAGGLEPGMISIYADIGLKAESGGRIEIDSSVYGFNYAAWADGEGSSIIINGTAQSELLNVDDIGPFLFNGAYAENGATIQVNGNVIGSMHGATVHSGGSITVTGNVTPGSLGEYINETSLLSEAGGGTIKV
ncbi:MAG: hypothetical protein FWH57_00595, partial [Oscillospiraceae bacterium]|nr:hypothetical protein [Oscillospiraceae bacterium]